MDPRGAAGRDPPDLMMYTLLHSVVPPVARRSGGPRCSASTTCRASGGVILASNHLSFADSLVIPIVVPRKVAFLAKSDYFTGSGVKGAVSKAWFEGMGMLPVDRDDKQRRPGEPGHGADGARPRRGVRHLPRGHPVARRPALPRPHRRRPPRPDRRRAGGAGRAGRHRQAAAGRQPPPAKWCR